MTSAAVVNPSVSEAAPIALTLQADDFALFSVQRAFTQDIKGLENRWKALQSEAHPDKFAAQGASAQRIAMQWSVRINEAYQRLKDPLKRAAYLCELAGVPVQAHTNTAMPAAFLFQQMEWREQLEEARDLDALEALQRSVELEKQRLFQACAEAIDQRADWDAAVGAVRALMFIDKFLQDLFQQMDQV